MHVSSTSLLSEVKLFISHVGRTHTPPMVTSMKIYGDSRGKRIAWARKQRGMTGHELARAIGVRNVHLSYLENDHRDMSLPLLQKIASVLGVTVGFLLMETDTPNPVSADPEAAPSSEAAAAVQLIEDAPAEERARMLAVLRAMAGETAPVRDETHTHATEREAAGFSRRLVLGDNVSQPEPRKRVRVEQTARVQTKR
jgi:transcriptional regulator with XRE-family HTH domain